jgi:hypothetical protein
MGWADILLTAIITAALTYGLCRRPPQPEPASVSAAPAAPPVWYPRTPPVLTLSRPQPLPKTQLTRDDYIRIAWEHVAPSHLRSGQWSDPVGTFSAFCGMTCAA